VRVLAPICADKFQHSADVGANLTNIKDDIREGIKSASYQGAPTGARVWPEPLASLFRRAGLDDRRQRPI